MKLRSKKFFFSIVTSIIVMSTGLGTSFAISSSDSFEEYCLQESSNDFQTADDFICELNIFQMKEDIEKSQQYSFESSERFSQSLVVFANSQNSHIAACPEGTFITNVGHTGTDVGDINTGFELNVHTSFQLNDNQWVLVFANQSEEDIPIVVKYTCLG